MPRGDGGGREGKGDRNLIASLKLHVLIYVNKDAPSLSQNFSGKEGWGG